jgi:hypothetical protein
MAFQVLVDADGEVTFNYGTIGPNLFVATSVAGWTEGQGSDGERVVLPRDGSDGYADSASTALVHGSRNADLPGRYRFTFTGFSGPSDRSAAVSMTAPSIAPADAIAGDTLTVDTGEWDVGGGSLDDLTLDVQWLRDGTPTSAPRGARSRRPRTARAATRHA